MHPEAALTFTASAVEQLFLINVWLVIFNMLPAFPMDGGRVLRALLAMRLGARRATDIAAKVGKGMAILFGLGGLVSGNFMLVLIALFVWMGADAGGPGRPHEGGTRRRPGGGRHGSAVRGPGPRRHARGRDRVHPAGVPARLPVVVSGRVVGLISREDIRAGLAEYGPTGRVFQVMRRNFPTVGPDEPAERGLALLAAGDPVVPVVVYGQLAGLLTPEHLSEFVWVRGQPRDGAVSDYEVRSPT